MKELNPIKSLRPWVSLFALALAGHTVHAFSNNVGYAQINLVSDLAGVARQTDARLVNPWGIVAGPSAVWVNDNGTGSATTYSAFGTPFRRAIFVPAPGGGRGKPTGLCFNESFHFILTRGMMQA